MWEECGEPWANDSFFHDIVFADYLGSPGNYTFQVRALDLAEEMLALARRYLAAGRCRADRSDRSGSTACVQTIRTTCSRTSIGESCERCACSRRG